MTERKTVRKWFWVWEFEKEEQWLNAMAQSGWLLDGVGFFTDCFIPTYRFIPCAPGEYSVRMEMRGHDEDYLRLMEETGAEYVGRMAKWIYFRKPVEYGAFDIFSDIDSKLAHLSRIGKLLGVAGAANLAIGLSNSVNPVLNVGWINLLCATVLMYGLGRIHGKKESLEKERLLRE